MPDKQWSPPTRRPLPLILIRGFGFLNVEDEKRIAYQGFNDGTVYPRKRGENYIYEGMILRFMKSNWSYQDATNVVGYYGSNVEEFTEEQKKKEILEDARLKRFDPSFFFGNRVVVDPAMARHLLKSNDDIGHTMWVFRYYDLDDRTFNIYGEALIRLIDFIREIAVKDSDEKKPKVNIIAHSMGGLIVREAIQHTYPKNNKSADDYINKIVTLGTPHKGITFQLIKNWLNVVEANQELDRFSPANQEQDYVSFRDHFPVDRLLTVVGTNYRTYNIAPSSWANRLFSVPGEYGVNYNRSDGLVKQENAQLPGAPRTFVHKCHGGFDSLVTARESFEVATRFFFGNVRARLRLLSANITRGMDWFGKSEFFLGVSIKPRKVDFDLFHQSAEAENCYGPFRKTDLSDETLSFTWADGDHGRKIIWEGYLNTLPILEDESITPKDMVIRLDFYVGERDLLGVGFSDNVIFRNQYYIRALLPTKKDQLKLYLHTDERFAQREFKPSKRDALKNEAGAWNFKIGGTGFEGTFAIELEDVPEEG
jgi:Predicted acetyltransferases and hydrolases with the alpha/beta hydrolase fold